MYPNRDYNRAIDIPKEDLGVKHEEVLTKISDKIENITKSETQDISEELQDTEGFLEVKEKLKEIKDRIAKVFTDNPDYVDFTDKLAELVKSHAFFKEESAGGKGSKKMTPPFLNLVLLYALSFSIIRYYMIEGAS